MKSLLRGKIFYLAMAPVFFCLAAAAYAESVVYESALVWRTDEQGDFRIPRIEPQSIYEVTPGVETAGVIQSVTVSWRGEGDVRFEVSADGGLHYAPATNGVPLAAIGALRAEGFIPGTTLRWRASLGEEAALEEVRMSYVDSSGVVGDFGNPALSGFVFRRGFFVRGVKGRILVNHQVRVRLGTSPFSEGADFAISRAKPDFSDVRFVLPDGRSIAPHFLERITGSSPLRTAHFFVKIPQIPPEGIQLFVYYANPEAENASDPEAVFDFFDDFSLETAAGAEKWILLRLPGGTVARTPSGLLVDGAKIVSRGFQLKDGVIEYSATAETGYEARLIIRDAEVDSSLDTDEVAYASGFAGAEHCIATGRLVRANVPSRIAPLARYDYRVTAEGEHLTFERWETGFTERQAVVSARDSGGPRRGHIGFESQGPGRGKSISHLHWIRVRKYSSSEPAVEPLSISGEEKVVAPILANVAEAADGSLFLSDGTSEGLVVLPPAGVLSHPARILSPSWKGENISVDVTADAETFRKDCANLGFYYAARGDFSAGSHPALRVNFKRKNKDEPPRLESVSLRYASGFIVVISPNGGETLHVGEEYEIRWSAPDYEEGYPFTIEFSGDGGRTLQPVARAARNTGRFLWRVADAVTETAVLRASDSHDSAVFDVSDGAFAIN